MTYHPDRHFFARFVCIIAVCAAAAIPLSCDDDDPVESGPFDGTIDVGANFFSPETVTISQGDSVTWVWQSGAGTHTVTDGAPPNPPTPLFDSPQMSSGTFGYRFMVPGTYPYFCRVHGAAMSGTITVAP